MKLPVMFDDPKSWKTYPAGATLFKEGEPGDFMYVMKSGEINIEIDGQIVDTAGADTVVGEMALLDDAPRSATAIAKTDSVVLPITQGQFVFMVQETPFFAIEVMRIMSARLRHKNAK